MKGGSREINRPTIIAQLKMEDAYILCIIIETICRREITKIERGRPFGLFQAPNNIGTFV
jgi:hypothetical protein